MTVASSSSSAGRPSGVASSSVDGVALGSAHLGLVDDLVVARDGVVAGSSRTVVAGSTVGGAGAASGRAASAAAPGAARRPRWSRRRPGCRRRGPAGRRSRCAPRRRRRRLVVGRLLDAVGDGGLGGGVLGRRLAEPGVGLLGRRVLRRDLAGDGVLGRGLLGRHRLDVDDARPRLDHPGQQREVLAQRVALELRRQVHVAQVGVAGEADAEHLVGLPLVPVGAGVDGEPRLDGQRVVGDVGLERDADVAAGCR